MEQTVRLLGREFKHHLPRNEWFAPALGAVSIRLIDPGVWQAIIHSPFEGCLDQATATGRTWQAAYRQAVKKLVEKEARFAAAQAKKNAGK